MSYQIKRSGNHYDVLDGDRLVGHVRRVPASVRYIPVRCGDEEYAVRSPTDAHFAARWPDGSDVLDLRPNRIRVRERRTPRLRDWSDPGLWVRDEVTP